jgi:hypothetical protein
MPLVHLHAGDLAIVPRCAGVVANAGDEVFLGIERARYVMAAPW